MRWQLYEQTFEDVTALGVFDGELSDAIAEARAKRKTHWATVGAVLEGKPLPVPESRRELMLPASRAENVRRVCKLSWAARMAGEHRRVEMIRRYHERRRLLSLGATER